MIIGHRNDSRPGFCKYSGVRDRKSIINSGFVNAGQAFGEPQCGAYRPPWDCPSIAVLGREYFGFDDQCMPFPASSCIAQPLAKRRVNMGPSIERHDPVFTEHFLQNDNVIGRLHYSEIVVVWVLRKHSYAIRNTTLAGVKI